MNKYWKKSESNIYHYIGLVSFQIGVEQNDSKVQVYEIFTQSLKCELLHSKIFNPLLICQMKQWELL